LCVQFPTGYTYVGAIQLDNFEYAVFLKSNNKSGDRISLVNTKNCSIQTIVDGECLNFDTSVRGVYKTLNSTNERVIYFIDGNNPNRYLNIDKALSGDFPKEIDQSDCSTCGTVTSLTLDCNQIRINKEFRPPCLTLKTNRQGSFPTGTYQVGIAYSEDGLTLTDYYFSDTVKVQSYKDDIGFEMSVACIYNPFSKFSVILVSQTKEGSLIVYNFGEYNQGTTRINLNSLSSATVIDTSVALSKKVVYDRSEHIVSNEETLLLGKHKAVEPLEYQPYANEIEVEWVERKVHEKEAHLFPNLLRDEVYDLSIEWTDEVGQIRGIYPIPGRATNDNWYLLDGLNTYHEQDLPTAVYLYETLDNCETPPDKLWQVLNTSYITESYPVTCMDCNTDIVISKVGKMGYYECADISYPDEDRWGTLRCQPVRRHRMPSSDLTHIHGNGTCISEVKTYTVWDDVLEQEIEQTYTVKTFKPDDCINILGIRLKNIPIPIVDGKEVKGWTYRLMYSDRTGNKSILHKGLIYNVAKEVDSGTEIMYPNYPYNDLKPDQYLSKNQTRDSFVDIGDINHVKAGDYYQTRFTYHSPETSFKETQNEFGTELKLYTEEIGKIKGDFKEVYRHPKVGLGADDPDTKTSWPYAQQFNSAAHYEGFANYQNLKEDRRKITNSQWLLPIKQLVGGKRFNNEKRETSYYVELHESKNVPNTLNEDTSRFTRGDIGCADHVDFCDDIFFGSTKPIQAVSHYVGVKTKQPNQYGNIGQVTYKPMDSCHKRLPSVPEEGLISQMDFFGGDTYISRHSFFRKMPLFSEWLYDVPYNTEYNYRDKRNVYYPTYWFDNLTDSQDRYRLTCFHEGTLENDADDGHFYIWVTGNAYFWCESEFIGNYREIDSTPNSRFYPKTDYNEIAKADNISLQPTFLYDFSLLKDTIENYRVSGYTKSDALYTVTYSLKNDLQSGGDNWLKFLPLNYTILPQVYGEFTGMHYVDQYSIFFIFENMILFSQEDYTLQSQQGNTIFLGQGDIFSRRLKKLANDKTGYTGSVDPHSFINTRYGTFFFDRLRKKLFQWTGQLKELTGFNSFLERFTDFQDVDYENSMVTVFDNFTNKVYFTDKINNWTVSYKPSVEGFISFHSFVPDWYLTMPNNFLSVKGNIWKHNKKFDFQRYYGIPYPFDIGFVEVKPEDVELQTLSIDAEFYKPLDYSNKIYVKDRFFDKVFVYNHQGSTGFLEVILKDKNNRLQEVIQNQDNYNQCEVTHVKGISYNINKLENNHTQPFPIISQNGMTYTPLNIVVKNPRDREDIKGKWFMVHLISNNKENEKIIVHLNNPTLDKIQR